MAVTKTKTKPSSKAKTLATGLVVTTSDRGVFFGYGFPTTEKTIRIEKARMCVSWSSDIRGVVGLAAVGPSKNCKISWGGRSYHASERDFHNGMLT